QGFHDRVELSSEIREHPIELLDARPRRGHDQLTTAFAEQHAHPLTRLEDSLGEDDVTGTETQPPRHQVGIDQTRHRHSAGRYLTAGAPDSGARRFFSAQPSLLPSLPCALPQVALPRR